MQSWVKPSLISASDSKFFWICKALWRLECASVQKKDKYHGRWTSRCHHGWTEEAKSPNMAEGAWKLHAHPNMSETRAIIIIHNFTCYISQYSQAMWLEFGQRRKSWNPKPAGKASLTNVTLTMKLSMIAERQSLLHQDVPFWQQLQYTESSHRAWSHNKFQEMNLEYF